MSEVISSPLHIVCLPCRHSTTLTIAHSCVSTVTSQGERKAGVIAQLLAGNLSPICELVEKKVLSSLRSTDFGRQPGGLNETGLKCGLLSALASGDEFDRYRFESEHRIELTPTEAERKRQYSGSTNKYDQKNCYIDILVRDAETKAIRAVVELKYVPAYNTWPVLADKQGNQQPEGGLRLRLQTRADEWKALRDSKQILGKHVMRQTKKTVAEVVEEALHQAISYRQTEQMRRELGPHAQIPVIALVGVASIMVGKSVFC